MPRSKKYLIGKWNARSSQDVYVAWAKQQTLDKQAWELINGWVEKDARPISEGQKRAEAAIQYMGGDGSVALLYENDTHLVVLSTDWSIQVLSVIDRNKQVAILQEESY